MVTVIGWSLVMVWRSACASWGSRSVVVYITGASYRMRAHRARSRKLTQGGPA